MYIWVDRAFALELFTIAKVDSNWCIESHRLIAFQPTDPLDTSQLTRHEAATVPPCTACILSARGKFFSPLQVR